MKQDEITKGRFELERVLNENSDAFLFVIGRYIWEFRKPSARKFMSGELTSMMCLPKPSDDEEEDWNREFGEINPDVLTSAFFYEPTFNHSEGFNVFSNGETEKFRMSQEDVSSFLIQSLNIVGQSLSNYSKIYKTRLKNKHIHKLGFQMFFHNISSPVGKELMFDMQSEYLGEKESNSSHTERFSIPLSSYLPEEYPQNSTIN
jgi:hypothetical protein